MPAVRQDALVTVLVGGHESAHGADLIPLLDVLPGAVITPSGRSLHDAVTRLLADDAGPVMVLPMTWGRDPVMVAETAKTLRWSAAEGGVGRIALCAEFGTADHLIAWLRRAAADTARQRPGAGLIIAAPASNPFDDAELHRIAHLVRTYGTGIHVEVACIGDNDDLARAIDRSRLLGTDEVVVVPAGFARTAPAGLPADHASFFGPLISEQALLDVVRRRVAAARHELSHGRDGIAAGLVADHGHGYAHSHGFEDDGSGHHPHHHGHAHETPDNGNPFDDEVLTSPH